MLFEQFKGEFWFICSRVVLLYSHPRQRKTKTNGNNQRIIVVIISHSWALYSLWSTLAQVNAAPSVVTVQPAPQLTLNATVNLPGLSPVFPFTRSLLKQLGLNIKSCPRQPELRRDPLGTPMVHLHRSTHQLALLPSQLWPKGMPLTLTRTRAADPGAFHLPLAAVCPQASCLFPNCLLLLESWQDFANSVAL